jgi:hypothetical protein
LFESKDQAVGFILEYFKRRLSKIDVVCKDSIGLKQTQRILGMFEKCLTDDAMQQEILEPYIKART